MLIVKLNVQDMSVVDLVAAIAAAGGTANGVVEVLCDETMETEDKLYVANNVVTDSLEV